MSAGPAPRPAEAASEGSSDQVVVIAASAGGLEALRAILPTLPPSFPAPIIVVLHRTEGREGMLRRILARATTLTVKDMEEGDPLTAGMLYIAPPNQHAHITDDRRLTLTDHVKINFLRGSADPLFRTAASVYHARAIGVVLTGGGHNGAAGARAIRDEGGAVIAQDQATSRHFSMPRSAIEAGAATNVLPLDQIGPELNALTSDRADRIDVL